MRLHQRHRAQRLSDRLNRGVRLYFIIGILLLTGSIQAQGSDSEVAYACQDVTIARPWSADAPICWPTTDNVIYSMWPTGTTVDGYTSDGGFFNRLLLVFNPRSGNVCSDPSNCYYSYFYTNIYNLQGKGADWLENESVQDMAKLMGCFSTNDLGDGRFTYEYLMNVAETGLQQRYVSGDSTSIEPMSVIVPFNIKDDTTDVDGSGLKVASAPELSIFRLLANTLAVTSALKPLVRSCTMNYLPYLTADEQAYLLTLSDAEIARKKSTTSQETSTPNLIVDDDVEIENGCSLLYDYKDEVWNGLPSLLEHLKNYRSQLASLASSNDRDLIRFTATPAFNVYSSALTCLGGMLDVLHDKRGVFDDQDDTKTFFGWYGTNDDWWTTSGSNNSCRAFIDLYMDKQAGSGSQLADNPGSITQAAKADAMQIFSRNIVYNKRAVSDPAPGIMRATRQILVKMETLLAAQVKVQGVKGGNTYLRDPSTPESFKSSIYDKDLPFPQIRYVADDARVEDSACAYKPLTEVLTDNNMQDDYELLQRELIAKYVDFDNGAPFVGFDTTQLSLTDLEFPDTNSEKVIPKDNQVLFVLNGKFNRYAEYCLSGEPNASRILQGMPKHPDTNVNDKRAMFPPKQYRMYQKAQQEVLDQMRIEYDAYQKALMAVNLRRAIQVYQAKLQMLKTMQFSRDGSGGSCYFSLTEHYALAAKFRSSTDYNSLIAVFNLSSSNTTPDTGVLAYQAFLDRQINNQGSRVLDIIRDYAFMKYIELYTMYEWIKLVEVQNMYLAAEKVAAMKDPLDSLKFMVKDSFTEPVENYYRAVPTSAGVLEGEGSPPLGGEPEMTDEEKELTQGTPEQSGNGDTCVTSL